MIRAAAVRKFAVIGGGWAGCAAAVELARAGHQVTLFEAARNLGGRARAVTVNGLVLDNGQHILLGAYSATLKMLKQVGIDRRSAFLTLPLQMRYPAGAPDPGMDFVAPRLPAPLHLAVALLRARGLSGADKLALSRFSTSARWMDWTLHTDCPVAELLERFDQTPRLIQLMWRPLCLAALNTPPERASAQVFLAVLRDSLGAKRAASDMLLPRVDLTTLFPQAAAAFIESRGGTVRLGAAVKMLTKTPDRGWLVDGAAFDGAVIATPPPAAAKLLGGLELAPLGEQLGAFDYEAITTCYLQYAPEVALPMPFCALVDAPAEDRHGQFVFDRGQLDTRFNGLLAVVVSAAGDAAALDQHVLAAALAKQLAADFAMPALSSPLWQQVITDKRATFACTPGLARPSNATGLADLVLAGDYTAGDYPATLESAVRSGIAAATLLGIRQQ